MAIGPGRYNFTGGAFLGGDGTDVKRGDIKSLTLVCPKYDDETGVYTFSPFEAKTLFSRFLLIRQKGEVVGSYQALDDSSPYAQVIDIPEDNQIVLRRYDMSSPFSDSEFLQCQNEMSNGRSVVVQFASGGLREAALVRTKTDGALVFASCAEDRIVTYTVAPGASHYITTDVVTVPSPDSVLTMRIGGLDKTYTPTGPNQSIDIDSEVSRVYLAKGSASVATLNATIPGLTEGWSYVLTDSGTLTAGSVSVDIGDNVAWNGSEWFKIGNQVAVNALFIVQNNEFSYAIVDSNDTLLFGIKTDGSVTWSKGIPETIKVVLDSIQTSLLEKVDKVPNKTLVDSDFASTLRTVTNQEYLFAILDSNDSVLFGIDRAGHLCVSDFASGELVKTGVSGFLSTAHSREFVYLISGSDDSVIFGIRKDGTVICDSIVSLVKSMIADGNGADRQFVLDAVDGERTRAELAEQSLQDAINDLNPTTVIGGSNNPDNMFLTELNGTITLKDTPAQLYGKRIKYVRSTDSIPSVLVNADTIYIIRFAMNISGTATIPSGCVLWFEGGCLYNGTLVGNNTKILGVTDSIFSTDVQFSGTWDIPIISTDMLTDTSSNNSILNLLGLLDDNVFNEFIIKPGMYNLEARVDADKLINLKSNTRLRIDGNLLLLPNGYPHYNVVYVESKKNVEICGNGKITCDADTHDYITIPSTHEWGMCIEVRSSTDVTIHDITLENATGDGIECAGERLQIENVHIDHCGRQGISILTASNVIVQNVNINDIYRTSPRAGIDIEPYTGVRANNVQLLNIKISNCAGLQCYYSDNVSIDGVIATDCDILMYGNDVSDVRVRNIRCTGNAVTSSDFFKFTNVDRFNIDDSFIDTDVPALFTCSGLGIGLGVVFGVYVTLFGVPTAGTLKYDGTKLILSNGSAWTNVDGSPI